jgi:hypothetical protein
MVRKGAQGVNAVRGHGRPHEPNYGVNAAELIWRLNV